MNAIRIVYASGLVAVILAATRTLLGTSTEWFDDAIYTSAAGTGSVVAVLWFLSETLQRFAKRRATDFLLLAVALFAVAVPWLYVVTAAFFGQERADYNTWHLLPMFSVMHQCYAVASAGVVGAAILILAAIIRRLLPSPRKGQV